jgi:hypothetical protein
VIKVDAAVDRQNSRVGDRDWQRHVLRRSPIFTPSDRTRMNFVRMMVNVCLAYTPDVRLLSIARFLLYSLNNGSISTSVFDIDFEFVHPQ